MPADIRLTTQIFWTCAGILLVVDIILAFLARRFVSRQEFQQLRLRLPVVAGFFFLLVWISVLVWGWDWFYIFIFPSSGRFWLPPVFTVGYFCLALGMVWLSQKLPGSPAVTWIVLGGVEGLLSHLIAIYGLGAASNPPIMQGTDSFAVLIFAIFEKAFYWTLILFACKLSLRVFSPRLRSG